MVEDVRSTAASDRPKGRRQEYAETTRRAIVDAARRLFAERGYFATRVEDIATAARVAPATVYSVGGGKHGLLQTLAEIWVTAPDVQATDEDILRTRNPDEIIKLVSHRARGMREEYGDIIRVILATAPNDSAAADTARMASKVYRDALGRVAQRLADLGALSKGVDVPKATDMLWLYFGYAGLFTMHDDNGWSWDQAEEWLAGQASHAVIGR
jgi:AcrR family transcriptional regulator